MRGVRGGGVHLVHARSAAPLRGCQVRDAPRRGRSQNLTHGRNHGRTRAGRGVRGRRIVQRRQRMGAGSAHHPGHRRPQHPGGHGGGDGARGEGRARVEVCGVVRADVHAPAPRRRPRLHLRGDLPGAPPFRDGLRRRVHGVDHPRGVVARRVGARGGRRGGHLGDRRGRLPGGLQDVHVLPGER